MPQVCSNSAHSFLFHMRMFLFSSAFTSPPRAQLMSHPWLGEAAAVRIAYTAGTYRSASPLPLRSGPSCWREAPRGYFCSTCVDHCQVPITCVVLIGVSPLRGLLNSRLRSFCGCRSDEGCRLRMQAVTAKSATERVQLKASSARRESEDSLSIR